MYHAQNPVRWIHTFVWVVATVLFVTGISVTASENHPEYILITGFEPFGGDTTVKKSPCGFLHVPPLNAKVRTRTGNIVIFDKPLLQKTAEIIIQTIADTLAKNNKEN